jgi:hypothetical protein
LLPRGERCLKEEPTPRNQRRRAEKESFGVGTLSEFWTSPNLQVFLILCSVYADFFFFLVLEFELQGLHLEPLHQSFFVMDFFSRKGLENYLPRLISAS